MAVPDDNEGVVALKRRKRRRWFWRLLRVASVVSFVATTGLLIISFLDHGYYYHSNRVSLQCSAVGSGLAVNIRITSGVNAPGPARWGMIPAAATLFECGAMIPRLKWGTRPGWAGTTTRFLDVACPAALLWAIAGVLPFTLLVILPWARRAFDPRDIESVPLDRTVAP